MPSPTPDEKDREIVQLLQGDPDVPHREIARKVGLSQPAVSARIHRLRQQGFLKIQVGLDADSVGLVLAKVSVPRGGIYAVHNYEFPLALCAGAFALVTTGAGLLSLDAATFERTSKSRPKPKA